MTRPLSVARLALAVGIGLAACTAAQAQSTTLQFTNTQLDPIPLLDNSTLSIDSAGNVVAQCVPDGDTCQGITGAGAGAPGVNLSLAGGGTSTTLTGPGNIQLSWTSTNAPEVCMARSTPTVSGWTGVKASAGTSQSVSLTAAGDYDLSLECYNDNGSGTSATVSATVEEGGGGGPVPNCTITSSDPLFQPSSFVSHVLDWEEVFYGNSFPVIKSGGLAPVGSFTFRSPSQPSGIPIAGNYISVPFVPAAGTNYKVEWYRAQAITARNYRIARPADSVYVTISPCAGDFRLRSFAVPNTDALHPNCRTHTQDGTLFYGTTGGAAQCALQPGQTYFLNIIFADPGGGLSPVENTCADGSSYCDANFGS